MTGLRLLLAILLTLIVQLAVVRKIAILGVQPDLTILLVVLLALRRGPRTGTLLGFAIGLLQDLLVPETLGMNALSKSVVGWAVGKLSRQLALEGPMLYFGLVGVTVLAHDFIYLVCLTRLDVGRLLTIYFTHSVPAALYTALVSTLIGLIATVFSQSLAPGGSERGSLGRG